MTRFNYATFIIIILCGIISPRTHAESISTDVVKIAVPSWDGGQIIAYHLGMQITSKIPVKVEYVSLEGGLLWTELDRDNGRIDIFPDLWMPNQEHGWATYIGGKQSVFHNQSSYNGHQGFYVLPLTDALHEKVTIDTLKQQDFIDMFDSNGNGVGEYWPGDPAWHATLASKVKIENYKLDNLWEEINASGEEFLEIIKKRHVDGYATLFYYWEPDWIHTKYTLINVKEHEYFDGCRNMIDSEEDPDWLEKSTFACAYPMSFVHVIYRDELKSIPGMMTFLMNYRVEKNKLEEAMFQYKQNDLPIEKSAEYLN